MGKELDWTEEKVAAQLADVQTIYEPATG